LQSLNFRGKFEVVSQSTTDRELFSEIQKGNRLAFNTLFLRYYEPLCQFAYRTTNNYEEAEELVSDTFFMIWTKSTRLEIQVSLKSYLYTCVKNAALANVKGRSKAILWVESAKAKDAPSLIADAQSNLELTELQVLFQAGINQLPERCREVYTLNRIDNLPYKEISALLGISEKTVENHIVKALKHLRQFVFAYKSELIR
jgi:RNA polymerase sigma-70 factor (ECF subfamily)